VTCEILNRAGGIVNFDLEAVLQEIPVDVQGYCGCTQDAVAPATCNLCDGEVVNPDYILDNAGGMTCDELNVLVPWVTDNNFCTTVQNNFITLCCMEIMPTTAQPTEAATPAPITMSSPPPPTPETTAQPAASPPEPNESSSLASSSTCIALVVSLILLSL
jgi:hypothetical protein